MAKTILSVITPCFNEVGSIQHCIERLASVMELHLPGVEYEHIITDNASTDGTVDVLRRIATLNPRVKVIVNSRNIGAPRNIYSALHLVTGEAVIPMLPADLQDPPEVIPEFFHEWQKGFFVVYGISKNRQENFFLRSSRTFYYKLIHRFSEATIVPNAGEFMMIDRKVLQGIIELQDKNPFIRGLVAQSGSNFSTVQYTWTKRIEGKSKATPFVLVDQAINGLVSTSRIPARLSLLFGFGFSVLSILLGVYSGLGALFWAESSLPGVPTVIVAIFLFSGIQLFFLGLIGEYILSLHGQIKPEPKSFPVELINFNQES